MSRPSLFAEPRETESTDKKFLKRIDELIDESEIEAMAEIDKQIRYKNAKFALIALVAVALAGLLYLGIENQSLPGMTGSDQMAAMDSTEASSPQLAPLKEAPADGNGAPGTPETAPSAPVNATHKEKPVSMEDMEQQAVNAISAALNSLEESKTAVSSSGEPEQTAAVDPKKTTPKQGQNILPVNPPSGNYFVQVGAFSVKSNADRMVKKLQTAGLPVQTSIMEGNVSKFKLVIGGFTSPDSGRFLLNELKGKGYSPQLVPEQGGGYSIVVSQTDSPAKAESMKDKLGKEGIFTEIRKDVQGTRPIYVVRVGGFATQELAFKYKKEIAQLGYPKTLIRKIAEPAG